MALTKPILVPPWADTAAGTDIQKPADGFITGGWPNSPTPPSRQFFNWALNFAMNGVRYFTRRGLPDWGSDESYQTGDVVRDSAGASTAAIYVLTGTATPGLEPHSDLGNWSLMFPTTSPIFGDGSDGDLTVSGSTTFTGLNKQYNNLTVTSTGTLAFHCGVLRVKGTLTIQASGILHANGAAAVGDVGGVSPSESGAALLLVAHGGHGASGGTAAAGVPAPQFAYQTPAAAANAGADYTGYSANGGNGGAGNPYAGGTAATIPSDQDINAMITAAAQMQNPGYLNLYGKEPDVGETTQGTTGIMQALRGGVGGASGGGSGTGAGGGGGAGGGVLLIFANRIVLSGSLRARGGNGGAPTGSGNCGGGAGGGGGRIIVLHGGLTGSPPSSTSYQGGAGSVGLGTGGNGAAGATGQLLFAQVA